jgi:hypothetical protein
VDIEAGFFFSAGTLAELAGKIVNKYQKKPIPPAALEATVARYNSFVDSGKDADFQKPTPRYKIQTPPFYAAWATPLPHDSKAGLRINARCQVQDMEGKVIPGLYCGGESAGGFSQHGVARAVVQGLIAARNAVVEKVRRRRRKGARPPPAWLATRSVVVVSRGSPRRSGFETRGRAGLPQPGRPISMDEHTCWRPGAVAKIRLLHFKKRALFRHYCGLQNHV